MVNHNRVAILDAGSQFGKLIDRRLHEIGIEPEFVPLDSKPESLSNFGALIISGSPGSVTSPNALLTHPDLFKNYNKPILGICYGMQLINKHYLGLVEQLDTREDAQFTIDIDNSSSLFQNLDNVSKIEALLTHGDQITAVAENFKVIANAGNIVSAMQHETRPIFGVQFHPEVDLTPKGSRILKTFVQDIAKLECNFTIKNREIGCLEEIRKTVGDNMLVVLLSGGVDSSVLAVLCQKALGKEKASKQLLCLHIDNGFMRKNESSMVVEKLKLLDVDVQLIRAMHTFSTASTEIITRKIDGRNIMAATKNLCEVVDPEQKRCIIGDTFMRTVKYEIILRGHNFENCFIAQGTLRPDLIESASSIASSNANKIKTHHNDSQCVRELRKLGRVVEPLRNFHKDEVRVLGKKLGLPDDFINRHPFPGPGLAIRIICHSEILAGPDPIKETMTLANEQNTPSLIKTFVRYADAKANPNLIFTQLEEKLNPRDKKVLFEVTSRLPKLCAVLLPFRTVGVQGDARTYNLCAAISCDKALCKDQIKTDQFWKDLYQIAKILPTVAKFVNRVVYVFSDEAIDETPEFTTHTRLTHQPIEQLQESDHIVLNTLIKHNCYNKIAQMPVVLIPVDFNANDPRNFGFGKATNAVLRSICLRPILTSDFMTGVPALPVRDIPYECIEEIIEKISNNVVGISNVLIDLTPKPPGTIEWE